MIIIRFLIITFLIAFVCSNVVVATEKNLKELDKDSSDDSWYLYNPQSRTLTANHNNYSKENWDIVEKSNVKDILNYHKELRNIRFFQLVTSWFIFVFSHIIVSFALFCSYLEFRKYLKFYTIDKSNADTEVNVEIGKIAFKSRLFSGVLLLFSIIFYFLFITYVYKINVI